MKLPNSIVDWEQGIALASGKREVAEELLKLLIKNLPTELADIMQAYKEQDYKKLQQRLHKLHGALCYCGVPRLRSVTHALQQALKQTQKKTLSRLIMQLEVEAKKVMLYLD